MSGRVFKLFACCVPVRGARRSTLCDLQRGHYRLIPNGLYEILTVHRDRPAPEIKAAYGNQFDAEIDEYFAFLEQNEFGFWTDDPEAFPDLDLTWEAPDRVTNAVVDIGPGSAHDFARIFAQLDDLGCRMLQLRFFCAWPLAQVDAVLTLTDHGRLRAIELVLCHTPECTEAALEQLFLRHPRVANIFVHSAPEKRVARVCSDGSVISYRTEVVDSEAHCGFVAPAYFVVSMGLFTESQAHNSCLNRKIAVDQHGDIRNCPAMGRSFGKASETSLHAALLQQGFQELWQINKDQVETCKDCEFRYVCTDCRAFIREPSDVYSKPSRCAYDPYTAQWN